MNKLDDINDVLVSEKNVKIKFFEYIEDAYEEIMMAFEEGKIDILKYENLSDKKLKWIEETIINEYKNSINNIDYRHFLLGKFDFL